MQPSRASAIVALALTLSASAPALADTWSVFGHRQERGSGDITTEIREVSDFERIRLNCSADLSITIGAAYHVSVTTDDNLQDNIITEVSGRRTLIVDSEGSYSTRRSVRVEITVPALSSLEVDGSGNVDLTGLKSESFEIELDGSGDIEFDGEIKDLQVSIDGSGSVTAHALVAEIVHVETSGSGDVELDGKTATLECIIAGSGSVDAARLEADDVLAEISGSGDASVFAINSFDGAVYGSGDIDLHGDPKDVDRRVSGSGDIRRRR